MNAMLLALLFVIVTVTVLVELYVLFRRIGIKKLSYRRYFTQSGVFEGDNVFLIEEVCNPFFLPLFFVDVEAYIYANLQLCANEAPEDKTMQRFCSRFFLMPHTKIRRKHPVKCTCRGYYQLESVHVFFASDVIHIPAPATLYVYPRPLPVEESVALNREIQNNCLALHNLIQDPFSLSGVREYTRGDSFSSINFKATAKTGSLKVNERDPLSGRNFMVYINYQTDAKNGDLDASDYEQRMELALSQAAYLTQRAIDQGYKTGFAANAKTADGDRLIHLPRTSGTAHYEDILCAMAKVKNSAGNSFCSVMERDIAESMSGAEVFVFTLYVDVRMQDAIERIRRMGNVVAIRLITAEETA